MGSRRTVDARGAPGTSPIAQCPFQPRLGCYRGLCVVEGQGICPASLGVSKVLVPICVTVAFYLQTRLYVVEKWILVLSCLAIGLDWKIERLRFCIEHIRIQTSAALIPSFSRVLMTFRPNEWKVKVVGAKPEVVCRCIFPMTLRISTDRQSFEHVVIVGHWHRNSSSCGHGSRNTISSRTANSSTMFNLPNIIQSQKYPHWSQIPTSTTTRSIHGQILSSCH
jgi:hypothetical protein